ncbi:MAG: M17 family peptidase N-terminal domain-containing protein, partial [Brooklawnia sp.]|uniref:M17 family peptidase N-terminal domain-containing protein n=1 Tax=Brooklawnia sp. TaxID=2699740 RepID=UPI003C7959B7
MPADSGAVGYVVFTGEPLPAAAQLDAARAAALGFEAKPESTLVVPSADGPVVVLAGAGERDKVSSAVLRDAAAVFARAVPKQVDLALVVPDTPVAADDAAAALLEGAALARYVYRIGED